MCRTTSNFTLFGQTAHEYNSYNAVGYYPRLKVRYLVYIDRIYWAPNQLMIAGKALAKYPISVVWMIMMIMMQSMIQT